MRHVTIYREPGRFAGWPANYGIWRWGDEIVVGFTVGAHKTVASGHARDKSQPFINIQARSLNRGAAWQIEDFNGMRPAARGLSADEHMAAGLRLDEVMTATTAPPPAQPLSFQQPDFALMVARTGLKPGVFSFFYISADRCRSWAGPYRLPLFGTAGIAARTDYLIQGPHSALFFLAANKGDGEEGKTICVRTADGGMTFQFLSVVGEEPPAKGDFATMPASIQLPSGALLSALRCRKGRRRQKLDRSLRLRRRRALLALHQPPRPLPKTRPRRQPALLEAPARRPHPADVRQPRRSLQHLRPHKRR